MAGDIRDYMAGYDDGWKSGYVIGKEIQKTRQREVVKSVLIGSFAVGIVFTLVVLYAIQL